MIPLVHGILQVVPAYFLTSPLYTSLASHRYQGLNAGIVVVLFLVRPVPLQAGKVGIHAKEADLGRLRGRVCGGVGWARQSRGGIAVREKQQQGKKPDQEGNADDGYQRRGTRCAFAQFPDL